MKDTFFMQHWNFKSSHTYKLIYVFATPPWQAYMQSEKPDTSYGYVMHLQGNNWNDGTARVDAALQ